MSTLLRLSAVSVTALALAASSALSAGAAAAPISSSVVSPTETSLSSVMLTAPTKKKPKKRPRKGYQEYVSLGDSWSADVKFVDLNGTPDTRHTPIDCAQSQTNYPKLLAARLNVTVHRDATCGSATTEDFYKPQSLPLGGSNPPQFHRLTRKTDLVTVGIGGNDAGIASAALDCLSALPAALPLPAGTLPAIPNVGVPLLPSQLPLGGCKERFTAGGVDVLAKQIKASEPKLVRALRQIHQRSPKARILMVDYLAAVPKQGCYPLVPITNSDMAYLYTTFRTLNAMVKRAARRGGAEFVDTYTPTLGHDVCQGPGTRYAEVLGASVNGLAVGVPAHPNSAGAKAQFRTVLKQVRRR